MTRGLVEHGALFLPALLLLLALVGAPLVRLALATGQLDHRLAGREAVQPLTVLVRLGLAAAVLWVGARAVGWILTHSFFDAPNLEYQSRELTAASSSWNAGGVAFWLGGLVLAGFAALLVWSARRRRLAGLGWIGAWLLWLVAALFVLGLLAGFALPGAGALVALVAWPRIEPLSTPAFWADAATCALLASGAQAGLLASAGEGLPARAFIARESRILVTSMALVLVLAGLAGLVLLCALCASQGIVPQAHHATPQILLLELVPSLGRGLFPGWPEELKPTSRQVALTWQYVVALCCAFGLAALLSARRWLPHHWRSPFAVAGYAAAAVLLFCAAMDRRLGHEGDYLRVLVLLVALLALLGLTFARRAGPGMRLVSAAFGSARPWLERLNVLVAFRVARPVLVGIVVAVAATMREYSVTLIGAAVAFALVWIASPPPYRRPRVSRAGALAVAAILAAPLYAGTFADRDLAAGLLETPSAADRQQTLQDIEAAVARGKLPQPESLEEFRERLARRIEAPPEAELKLEAAEQRRAQARDALNAALMLAPDDAVFLRLERMLHHLDGIQRVRIDEAISEHAAGRPAQLREQCTEIAGQLRAPRLRALLQAASEPATHEWTLALAADLREAYGTAPPRTRELRQYLLARALAGRTLLRPGPATGGLILACLGLAAAALAVALALGLAPRRATA